ncbi:hypothetical protein ACHAW5_003782 [Stephanodiscus triporus]|uniref:purine-nucleoside phosphorylase n=1 Tax=Stephanodiscus triporus TaxID=2934178 RepID=A0ABD3QPF6_9STRA
MSSISPTPTPTPTMLDASHVPYRLAASYIRSVLVSKSIPLPAVGIVCGSGLSGLSDAFDDDAPSIVIPYSSIPHFPSQCSVVGHVGEMVVGSLNSVPTMCLRGRFHPYEGHDASDVVLPIRAMRCLGVRLVVLTNAAGGLRDEYVVGDVAVIRDHVALPLLAGGRGSCNPLIGPNDVELGTRFPPTSDMYDPKLRIIVRDVARRLGYDDFVRTDPGAIYAFVAGPQYESRAECKMLRDALGADAVGMSTVPESVAARHAGMAVLCLSLITNKVVYARDDDEDDAGGGHAHHEEVVRAANGRSAQMTRLVGEVVRAIGESYLPALEALSPIDLDVRGRVTNGEEGGEGEGKQRRRGGCGILLGGSIFSSPFSSIPTHCFIMGGAILVVGAVLGSRMGRRS